MVVSVNGSQQQMSGPSTVGDLLVELDLDPRRVAVEINRQLVTRKQYAATPIQDGDAIEIVTFVGGG